LAVDFPGIFTQRSRGEDHDATTLGVDAEHDHGLGQALAGRKLPVVVGPQQEKVDTFFAGERRDRDLLPGRARHGVIEDGDAGDEDAGDGQAGRDEDQHDGTHCDPPPAALPPPAATATPPCERFPGHPRYPLLLFGQSSTACSY
jgi:hypothetical protein